MEARYLRNLPALTEEECLLLRKKTVAVVGCGGLGGYLIEYLARIGIGAIRVVDGDVFEETNLNRQLLSGWELLGTSKAEAAAARVKGIDPTRAVRAFPVFLTEENAEELFAGCDAVLDGLDSIAARRILAATCKKLEIPLIFGAIGGWVAQAALSMPGDGLIDRLYPDGTAVRDKSALSFTPALCAALQISLCTKLLAGRPVEAGVLHYMDLQDGEFMKIPLEISRGNSI